MAGRSLAHTSILLQGTAFLLFAWGFCLSSCSHFEQEKNVNHVPNSILLLGCIAVSYVLAKGTLCCLYDFSSWMVRKLQGPDDPDDSE